MSKGLSARVKDWHLERLEQTGKTQFSKRGESEEEGLPRDGLPTTPISSLQASSYLFLVRLMCAGVLFSRTPFHTNLLSSGQGIK
jgi:hypothetical protein